jgi:hypothetical protein
MAEEEVKVFVSAPDLNNIITISVVFNGKTYTTTIAKLENDNMMKRAIKAMVTSLIRYNLGLKRKNSCVVVEENKAVPKRKPGSGRQPLPNPVKGEAKQQYDHERYLRLKAIKTSA